MTYSPVVGKLTPDVNPAHSKIAYIVVIGQVALAVICVIAICLTLFYKNYSDPVVVTALITLTGTLVGNLGSLLGGPQRMMQTQPDIVATGGTNGTPPKVQLAQPHEATP